MAKVRLFSKYSNPDTDQPILHKSRLYVDSLIETGEAIYLDENRAQLTGWLKREEPSLERILSRMAGSSFDSAWSERQSGYAGPLVWQMNS